MLMENITRSESPLSPSSRVADPVAMRETFGCFASGVTVVTCQQEDAPHGMTANSFISVSLEPPRALVSIKRSAKMHSLLMDNEHFGLSVLSAVQEKVSSHFAGREQAGFDAQFLEVGGVPVIDRSLAWMVCKRVQAVEIGDHTLFVGDILDCDNTDADPLVFYGGKYAAISARAHNPNQEE